MRPKHTQINLFDFDSPAEEQLVNNDAIPKKQKSVAKRNITADSTTPEQNSSIQNTAVVVEKEAIVNQEAIVLAEEIKEVETVGSFMEVIKNEPLEEEVFIDFSKNKFSKSTIKIEKTKSTRGRKSIKEMSESVLLVDVPPDDVLFSKSYYSIGKVAEMFKVNQSLIRLWENQFDILKPKKNGKGDRHFRPEDIKNIQLIHHLTRQKKYTMEGAKEYFKNNKKADEKFTVIESLKKLKGFLHELRANL
jgi:DNA-binding transcriptional MerR regulator